MFLVVPLVIVHATRVLVVVKVMTVHAGVISIMVKVVMVTLLTFFEKVRSNEFYEISDLERGGYVCTHHATTYSPS